MLRHISRDAETKQKKKKKKKEKQTESIIIKIRSVCPSVTLLCFEEKVSKGLRQKQQVRDYHSLPQ